MRSQLITAREMANGRGLYLRVQHLNRRVVTSGGDVTEYQNVALGVSASGPGVWSDFRACVVDRAGWVESELWEFDRFDSTFGEKVERKTYRVDRIDTFPMARLDELYLLVTWVQPLDKGLRSAALRCPILREDDRPHVESFHWYRTHRLRAWAQRTFPEGFDEAPLGQWKPVVLHDYSPTQVPGFPRPAE
ncbi:hypothetical protein SEA_OHGEESY_66 [Gordonia phage Ohgeesy]|uniref:Uncharacterized protein n=1 Tax=Gordonia phage Ohgeesy TaxID=2762412 RepID=A0A7G8LGC3_9CAUD|nr:hypothetical protein PP492_gp66 [Gordonia phage Ohgeesy]QNJ56295.1 hypothetical protein SEA_OHGEESY_66 [Gordonia phage Ohgeesy]